MRERASVNHTSALCKGEKPFYSNLQLPCGTCLFCIIAYTDARVSGSYNQSSSKVGPVP